MRIAKKGVSNIVSIVLLILLVLVAVLIIWALISSLIEEEQETNNILNSCLSLELDIRNIVIPKDADPTKGRLDPIPDYNGDLTPDLGFSVFRGPDTAEMSRLVFLFDGNQVDVEAVGVGSDLSPPGPVTQKQYYVRGEYPPGTVDSDKTIERNKANGFRMIEIAPVLLTSFGSEAECEVVTSSPIAILGLRDGVQFSPGTGTCGDGITQDQGNADGLLEECDEGSANSPTGTCFECLKTFCGDGVKQEPNGEEGVHEECDDGNADVTDGCTPRCRSVPLGGDSCEISSAEWVKEGVVVSEALSGEEVVLSIVGDNCVVGQEIEFDILETDLGIRLDKVASVSGVYGSDRSWVVEYHEDTNGATIDPEYIFEAIPAANVLGSKKSGDLNVMKGVLGGGLCNMNGIPEEGEHCDDGDHDLNDACDTFGETLNSNGKCSLTFCGDGFKQSVNGVGDPERCDDGNLVDSDNCRNDCSFSLGIPSITIRRPGRGGSFTGINALFVFVVENWEIGGIGESHVRVHHTSGGVKDSGFYEFYTIEGHSFVSGEMTIAFDSPSSIPGGYVHWDEAFQEGTRLLASFDPGFHTLRAELLDESGSVLAFDERTFHREDECTDGDGDLCVVESGLNNCGNDCGVRGGQPCQCSQDCDDSDPDIQHDCPVACFDNDGDGFFGEPDCGTPIDCDDSDPTSNPGSLELCGDGVDNNCDAVVDGSSCWTPIIACGVVIDVPGHYAVSNTLQFIEPGVCISIEASGVTLNGQGHDFISSGRLVETAIQAKDVSRVSVTNFKITSLEGTAISFSSVEDSSVSDVRASGNWAGLKITNSKEVGVGDNEFTGNTVGIQLSRSVDISLSSIACDNPSGDVSCDDVSQSNDATRNTHTSGTCTFEKLAEC